MLMKELKDIDEGEFELACPSITLRQAETSNPKTYSGSGLIYQKSTRQLAFKMIVASDSPIDPREIFSKFNRGEPGQLLSPSCFYTLAAKDINSTTWTSERIDFNINRGPDGLLIQGDLPFLTTETSSDRKKSYVRLHVLTKAKIRSNTRVIKEVHIDERLVRSEALDVAKMTVQGSTIRIHRDESPHLVVEIESEDASLPNQIEYRIVESLQFIFAKQVEISYVRKILGEKDTQTLWSTEELGNTALGYPIRNLYGAPSNDFWRLFGEYLTFVWDYPQDSFHTLSAWLTFARNATEVPISPLTQGLALGVAVEGILQHAFSDRGSPDDMTQASLAAIIEYVSSWNGDEGVKERVLGATQSMLQVRSKDQIRALVNEGVLTDKHRRAWDKLRNAAAHASPPGKGRLQDWIDLCHTTETTLYRLVFSHIGYSGKYTDYSERGHPMADFICPTGADEKEA